MVEISLYSSFRHAANFSDFRLGERERERDLNNKSNEVIFKITATYMESKAYKSFSRPASRKARIQKLQPMQGRTKTKTL